VDPLVPGLRGSVVDARVAVQPLGTVGCRVKVDAGQFVLSVSVTVTL